MKVIFLDIDGVLNTGRYRKVQVKRGISDYYNAQFNFDPICMRNLKEIVDKTGAKIVLSSTWRINQEDEYFNEFKLNLKQYDLFDSFISITPVLNSIRGDEIKEWLSNKNNVDEFIILDDEDDMGDLINRLIKCDEFYGFNDEKKLEALKLFNL